MFAVQRKAARSWESKSGKRGPERAHASSQPMLAARRASCACGGGCPRCRENYPLQAKLEVSRPGDTLEQEADRVAEQVLRMPQPALPDNPEVHKSTALRVSRYASDSPALSSPEAPPIVHEVLRSPGQPLDPDARAFMEPRFDHDFGQVRVHSGEQAEQSARTQHARAYTVGRHIVFGAGESPADSTRGRRLLAHELAHVVQQSCADIAPFIQRQAADPDVDAPSRTPARKGDCTAWESNRENFAKAVADHYVQTALGVSKVPPARTIWCSREDPTCEVAYLDDLKVMVSFAEVPNYVIARRMEDPFGPRCEYDYDCEPSGKLVLKSRNCFGNF